MQHSRASLLSLRSRFAGLPETAHKQIGLRKIRDALLLIGRNDAEANTAAGWAVYHLPYAESVR